MSAQQRRCALHAELVALVNPVAEVLVGNVEWCATQRVDERRVEGCIAHLLARVVEVTPQERALEVAHHATAVGRKAVARVVLAELRMLEVTLFLIVIYAQLAVVAHLVELRTCGIVGSREPQTLHLLALDALQRALLLSKRHG